VLDDIKAEIRFLEEWRNINNVHLAGGEPLIHPDIVDIVRFIHGRGLNPVIVTYGRHLTRDLLVSLRNAGLVEMSFHIDSGQVRPEWSGSDEGELNELRQHFTDLLWDVGAA
jgi:MoaA/NifB/PqqE/SkfB family radical SAM enzyme